MGQFGLCTVDDMDITYEYRGHLFHYHYAAVLDGPLELCTLKITRPDEWFEKNDNHIATVPLPDGRKAIYKLTPWLTMQPEEGASDLIPEHVMVALQREIKYTAEFFGWMGDGDDL